MSSPTTTTDFNSPTIVVVTGTEQPTDMEQPLPQNDSASNTDLTKTSNNEQNIKEESSSSASGCCSSNKRGIMICSASTCGCLVCLVVVGLIVAIILSHFAIQAADYETYVPPVDPLLQPYDGDQVIVVGGGTAGLFAAYTLQYLGVPYTLLEASPTFGGRVQRMEDFVDVPIDLGAEWIHTNPRILQDLLLVEQDQELAANNIEVMGYQPQTYAFWKNDYRIQRDWMRFFYKEYKFKNSTWSQYLEDYVVPYVQDHVVYNAVVQEVDYSGDKAVVVTTADGTIYTGDRVIMAVPLKILQDQDVRFVPALPQAKSEALEEVWWASGMKVFIEFQEKFYSDNTRDVSLMESIDQSYYGEDRLFFDGVQGKDQTTRHVMTLFTVGEPAEEWTSLASEEQIFERVMETLDELYDGQASQNYLQHRIQNWDDQPFIRGAYALEGDMDTLEQPVGNKLFFAFDTESTVHTAAISGRQAATKAAIAA